MFVQAGQAIAKIGAMTGLRQERMLQGVKFDGPLVRTQTVVMRSISGTVRWITAEHRQLDKF